MKYSVPVVRFTHSIARDLIVEANSPDDALDKALEQARYEDFSDGEFTYTVVNNPEELE